MGLRNWYNDTQAPARGSKSRNLILGPDGTSAHGVKGKIIPHSGMTPGAPPLFQSPDIMSAAMVQQFRANPDTFKSLPGGVVPSRAPRTRFHDPLSLMYATGYKDRRFSISYDALRRISYQLGLINSILVTRINQVAAFSQRYRENKQVGFQIRHKDPGYQPTEAERVAMVRLEQMILECGFGKNPFSKVPREDFESFLKKITRDSLQFDQMTFEIIPDTKGRPFEFRAVDASTIRLAATYDGRKPYEKGKPFQADQFSERWKKVYGKEYEDEMQKIHTVQVMHGRIENIYTYYDMAFGIRNPRTDIWTNGYGFSEAEMALQSILGMIWGETYNRKIFSNESMPKGIINIKGDDISPEQMECVAVDTLVQTNRGTISIDDAYSRQEDGESFHFWNGLEFAPGEVFEAGEKEVNRLTLEDGSFLRATGNHRVFVVSDSGMEEKFVEDLKGGEILLQNDQDIEYAEQSLQDHVPTTWGFKRRTSKNDDFVCEEIGGDLWELIGWQVGDGWISKAGNEMRLFYHGTKDLDAFRAHEKVLQKYGIPYKERPEKSSMRTLRTGYRPFIRFLGAIGVGFGRDKEIPWLLMSENRKKRSSFLRGLYSADGYVSPHGYAVGITSVYPPLLEGVQQLMNTLGISVYWADHSSENPDANQLVVRRRELFAERIGFIQDYKMESIGAIKQEVRTPSDRLPVDLLRNLLDRNKEYIKESVAGASQLGQAIASVVNSQKRIRILSRPYWEKFFREAGDKDAVRLLSYRFVRVESIEREGIESTYDVTIQPGHKPQFIANGVLTHNSFRRQWYSQVAGVENCIDGSTMIRTKEDGHVEVEAFLDGNSEKKASIWAGDDWVDGLVYKTKEKKQLCHTRLQNGASISTSPEHKFRVIHDGELAWRRQKDLEIGEKVVVDEKVLREFYQIRGGDGVENGFPFSVVCSKSTSYLLVPMYDVSMNRDDHLFIGNGVMISNSHKTPILQADGVEFQNFQNTNREMEFQKWIEYLSKIICSVFQIDPVEVYVDGGGGASGRTPMFESKNEWKIKHSKDKGLRPLLKFISKRINEYIIDPLDSTLMLDFVGLDELSEPDRIELIQKKSATYKTVNEVREEEGLEPKPGGDIILNAMYVQSKQMEDQRKPGYEEEVAPWGTTGDGVPLDYGEAASVPLYLQAGRDMTPQPVQPPPGGEGDGNPPQQ